MQKLIKVAIEQQSRCENDTLWDDFQETIKLNAVNLIETGTRISKLRNIPSLTDLVAMSYKNYPNARQIILPKAKLNLDRTLEDIIIGRRSIRDYSIECCSIETLSTLLQLSYGITGEANYSYKKPQYFRTIPSAGALYPLEIYVCVFHVRDLPQGVYHYRIAKHGLELLKEGRIEEEFCELGNWTGVEITKASFVVLISAIFERCTFKYGNRGYRFALLEVGYLSMLMNLIADALGMGACHLGGFYDDVINEYVGLNGVTESIQTVISFGYPV